MQLDDDSDSDSDYDGFDKRSWATKVQWRWLKRQRPAYLDAQKAGKLGKFLETMYHEFFEVWPESRQLFGHSNQEILTPEQLDQLAEAVKKRRHVRTASISLLPSR